MSRARHRRAATVITVAVLVGTAACSAPVDSGPKAIGAARIPAALRADPSSTTTTTTPTGESDEVTVYFIGKDDRLFPVKRRVSRPVSVEKVIQNLFAGPPTPTEAVLGLRTAISPDTTVLGAPIADRIVTVNVSKDFAFGTLPDQISAYAQVVFTASEIGGVTGVLFAQNGRRLEVPEGDGSLTSTAVGRASYFQVTPR